MSLAGDYRPCLNCGAMTDSGVCSQACVDDLDRERDERQRAAWIDAGRCEHCGGDLCPVHHTCLDCDLCGDPP
jgi:hypothetical protein